MTRHESSNVGAAHDALHLRAALDGAVDGLRDGDRVSFVQGCRDRVDACALTVAQRIDNCKHVIPALQKLENFTRGIDHCNVEPLDFLKIGLVILARNTLKLDLIAFDDPRGLGQGGVGGCRGR